MWSTGMNVETTRNMEHVVMTESKRPVHEPESLDSGDEVCDQEREYMSQHEQKLAGHPEHDKLFEVRPLSR